MSNEAAIALLEDFVTELPGFHPEKAGVRRAIEILKVYDEPTLEQVGWLGPYGIIPGGMDNEPNPKWQPIYRFRG